jgi:hypothetical protein
VRRTGTGYLIVGVLEDVMAVIIPVQAFMNKYSSYDTGTNLNARPAIHVQLNVSRGSAWVSAQLRL